MPESRRVYTAEFKVAAVKLVTEQGRSVAEAARSLGITEKILRQWKKVLASRGVDAFPGHGNPPTVEAEIRRLQEENKRLRMERDILKKLGRQT
ncbi:MAG: transposase [Gemmataceae bacterium]